MTLIEHSSLTYSIAILFDMHFKSSPIFLSAIETTDFSVWSLISLWKARSTSSRIEGHWQQTFALLLYSMCVPLYRYSRIKVFFKKLNKLKGNICKMTKCREDKIVFHERKTKSMNPSITNMIIEINQCVIAKIAFPPNCITLHLTYVQTWICKFKWRLKGLWLYLMVSDQIPLQVFIQLHYNKTTKLFPGRILESSSRIWKTFTVKEIIYPIMV